MASPEKDKRNKAPAEAEDHPPAAESDTDGDGLSPEQEEALNKIMAEIDAGEAGPADDDAEKGSETDSAGSATSDDALNEDALDEDGLDAEQTAALDKIMAEIEGHGDQVDETPSESEAKADTDGLDPEQEDALNKIMAEIEGRDEAGADPAATDDAAPEAEGASEDAADAGAAAVEAEEETGEGLDEAQEAALDKIMAEIEAQTESAIEEATADGEAPPAGDQAADAGTGALGDAGSAEPNENPEEGLSPDQEDALNKIMADIEAKDESTHAGDAGLSSEQEAALNHIMAEIEAQGDSGESPEEGSDASPETPAPPSEATPSEAPEADATASGTPTAEGASDTSAANTGEASAVAEPSTDQPSASAPETIPSTEDLMSQIQAAAQGSEEELNASPPPAAEVPPEPLAEIEPAETPAKAVASSPHKTKRGKRVSKKAFRAVAWSSAAAAVVILVAAATYFWLAHSGGPATATAPTVASTPSPTPTAVAPAPAEEVARPAVNDDLLETPTAPPAPARQPLEISPGSKQLAALSDRIRSSREEMLAKGREIEDLSAYYAAGIEKIQAELLDHINSRRIVDFKSALKDTALSMGLETIQRRAGYIKKLAAPRKQVHAAAEELLYLSRKAEVLSMIVAKSSGSNLDPFSKQVDATLERLSTSVSDLSLEAVSAARPTKEEIWKKLWQAHLNAPKSEPPATLAMRRNKEIWAEICRGDYTRVAEMSAISEAAAACLANWEGKDLFLNNLSELSPEAAHGLSSWGGEWLVLNGLKRLTPEAAHHLAAWNGKRLSLNGLKALPEAATQALAGWRGHQIEMIGLQRLASWDNPQVTLYVRSEVRDNLAR